MTKVIIAKERPQIEVESLDDIFAENPKVKGATPEEVAKLAEIQAYIDQNPWIYNIID